MLEFYQRSHLSQKMRNLKAYSIENTVITENMKNRQKKTEKLKRQQKKKSKLAELAGGGIMEGKNPKLLLERNKK